MELKQPLAAIRGYDRGARELFLRAPEFFAAGASRLFCFGRAHARARALTIARALSWIIIAAPTAMAVH